MADSAEYLLPHQGYVKRLAQSLVFEEALADDLEQQVWLAALQRPPTHGHALRGWLATIARNVAATARVRGARREERERTTARPEAVAAADELAAREELRAKLVKAVLALEEPFRETLILRYFDELPPRAIAARQRVPVATVKSRLKRALAELRARLDKQSGGRASWCLALVSELRVEPPLAAVASLGAKSIATGFLLMTTTKKLSLAAAVLVACFIAWRAAAPDAEPETVASPPAVAEQVPEVTPPSEAPTVALAAPAEPARKPLKQPWPQPKPREVKTGPGDLDVLVLAMPGRTPLADVAVVVRRFTEFEPQLRSTVQRTTAEGVAQFRGLEPGDIEVFTDRGTTVGMPGLVSSGELRTVELLISNPGDVRGRVVDAAGKPVEGADVWFAMHGNQSETHRMASTETDGTFLVRAVLAKSVYVFAAKRGHAASERKFNFVEPGVLFDVELVLRGPAGVLEGTVRDEQGAPIARTLVIAGPRGATTFDGGHGRIGMKQAAVATTTDEQGRYEFDGFLAGPSEVFAHAIDFVDATQPIDVQTGETARLDLRLARGAVLSGVVKRSDGKPAGAGLIQIRSLASNRLKLAPTDEGGAYRLGGLEPGLARVTAEDNRRVESLQVELELSADGTEWSPALRAGQDLAGLVLDASGKPARRLSVYVRRDASGEESFVQSSPTDREGRFRVQGCRDTDYVVTVYPESSRLFSLAEVRGVRPGGEDLVIRLDAGRAPSAYIQGVVVGPDGTALGGIKVTPSCAALDYGSTQLTGADGKFRAGPFPPGMWSLEVEAPGLVPHAIAPRELAAKQTLDLGRIQLEGGNVIDVHLVFPAEPHATQLYATVQGLDRGLDAWCQVEGDHARTPPLAPGRYRVSVEGAYASCFVDAEVVAGRETRVELALMPGIAFKLRLGAEAAAGPGRFTVRVSDLAGHVWYERSPRLGRPEPIELSLCLAPGTYRLEVTTADGRKTSRALEVDAALAQQVVAID